MKSIKHSKVGNFLAMFAKYLINVTNTMDLIFESSMIQASAIFCINTC